MNKRVSESGYTLIELLASLAILALLSLMITSGIVSGRRVWEHADTASMQTETVVSAQTILRNRFEHVFPQTRYDSSEPYIIFQGAADSVTFLAEPDGAHTPSALWRYKLALDASGNLTLFSVNSLANENAPQSAAVLLHGVQSFDVSYFGSAPPDNAIQWRSNWYERPGLPMLVRIRVQFADKDRRWWPDLIIRPAATIDSGCVLDSSTAQCRGRA